MSPSLIAKAVILLSGVTQLSKVSDAISKMSDEDIMASIKPRNIQSYSELMEWSKYLNAQIENGLSINEPSNEPSNEPLNEPSNEPTSD